MTRFPKRIESADRLIPRHIKLPTKFTHEGQAKGTRLDTAKTNCLRRRKGEGLVRQIGVCHLGQQIAALWTHQAEHRFFHGDIRDAHAGAFGYVLDQPVMVAPGNGGGRYHHVGGLAHPGDGQVRLYASAIVQPLRIDRPARGHRDIVG